MADFKVQRGQSSLADTVTSVTITAGTEYTAPSAITKAFIRITSLGGWSEGTQSQYNGPTYRNVIDITNPSNLLTSITFTRLEGSGTVDFEWEIIEYTGSAGGVNEFKVLGEEALSMASSVATVNSSVWTPANDADVVCFLTSQGASANTRTSIAEASCVLAWDSTSNYVTATRGVSVSSGTVSVAAVEFTGSNWKIQRSSHSITTADTDETETITAVSASTEAFLHVQHKCGAVSNDALNVGFKAWLSSTTQITFNIRELNTTHDVVAWVIENPDLVVEHKSGTWATSATDPDTSDVSVTTVSDMAETTIQGEGSTFTGSMADSHQGMLGFRLTSTSNVRLFRGVSDTDRIYRFSVVQLPTAAAGGTSISATSASLAITPNVATINAATGISANSVSLVVTTYPAAISLAKNIAASSASLAITANAATIKKDTGIAASSVALTVTPNAATVNSTKNIAATAASLSIITYSATVNTGTSIAASSVALAITPNNATVNASKNIAATTASLSITAYSASLSANTNIATSAVSLGITTYPATVNAARNIAASSVALSITPNAASLSAGTDISAGTATLTLTPYSASLNKAKGIDAAIATLTLVPNAATINAAKNIGASADSLTVTTYSATVSLGRNIAAASVVLSITPNAAIIKKDTGVSAGVATLTLTTHAATVALISDTVVNAGTVGLTVTPYSASINATRNIYASKVALQLFPKGASVSFTSPPLPSTANSLININLGNVPQIDDPQVYEAVLQVHSAIEAILDYLNNPS